MTAASYARKSTEQAGVADEHKSVARQIEHARTFAADRGWMVDENSIFVDDGISAVDFPNFAIACRCRSGPSPPTCAAIDRFGRFG